MDAFGFVPTIANASAAVVALRGRNGELPLAVAFADNLIAGQTGVQIALPLPAAPIAPGDGQTRVGADTTFSWSGDARLFVFVAEQAKGDEVGDALHVVTSAKQLRLPVAPDAPYAPPAGAQFRWHIETHGDFASVDAAAGSDGWISAFCDGRLHGPRRGPGFFSASAERTFTTAP